jgi:16S rRNA (guanine527-N7)-methyltransferase
MNLSKLIKTGAHELDMSISDNQIVLLIKYINLLIKWNKVFSLTAITNPVEIAKFHILDALSGIKYFSLASNILDVGSGMGVPAVILAIIYPDKKISAIDSNAKKTSFLTQVKIELALHNLVVLNKRVEDMSVVEQYDIITSRAFADLNLFIKLTTHVLSENGYYLAFKGGKGIEEANLILNWQVNVLKLNVPFLDAKRFLIKMEKYD